MRLSKKTKSLVAAIMTLSLVAPSAALAGGGHSYGHGDRHSGGYGKGYGKGHGKGHHGHYRKPYYKHHGGGHYYRGHHGKHVTKYKYEYDDDFDGEDLLIGLLLGGVVGYAIGDSRSSGSQSQYYAPAAPPREVYYTTPYNSVDGEGTCLQEREYTNKVIVGGKSVDAYGTACLQPDGSWRYGPARLASF